MRDDGRETERQRLERHEENMRGPISRMNERSCKQTAGWTDTEAVYYRVLLGHSMVTIL